MAAIIDGKKVSNEVLDEIKLAVQNRKKLNLKIPHLAAVLVGDDGPSQTYVNSKIRACERVGFESSLFQFDKSITENELISEIEKINVNDDIDGFIVQLPLPKGINQENILNKGKQGVIEAINQIESSISYFVNRRLNSRTLI